MLNIQVLASSVVLYITEVCLVKANKVETWNTKKAQIRQNLNRNKANTGKRYDGISGWIREDVKKEVLSGDSIFSRIYLGLICVFDVKPLSQNSDIEVVRCLNSNQLQWHNRLWVAMVVPTEVSEIAKIPNYDLKVMK